MAGSAGRERERGVVTRPVDSMTIFGLEALVVGVDAVDAWIRFLVD